MECQIRYNSSRGRGHLQQAIRTYAISSNDINTAFDTLITSMFGQKIQKISFNVSTMDRTDVAVQSIASFYDDFNAICDKLIKDTNDIEQKARLTQLSAKINEIITMEADETQSASTYSEGEQEIKTRDEYYNKNLDRLHEHLYSIYGARSWGIIQILKQEFADKIIGAAYYNSQTEQIISLENDTLNTNIQNLKSSFENTIKEYLDMMRIKYVDNPISIKQTFFKHISQLKQNDDFFNQLKIHYSEKLNQTDKLKKIEEYKNLYEKLKDNENFNQVVLSKLSKYHKTRIDTDLYAGDLYSPSYLAIKDFIIKNKNTLNNYDELIKYIAKIEQTSVNLLEAVIAYSSLVQFDSLLVESLGKQIDIEKGTFGIDIEGKYSYSQDTSHEVKGWQTSEDIGSEKHTSKFTRAVLSQIRVFDHKTGEFKNKRLDTISYIMAARHLIDDIVNGNIKILGDAKYVKQNKELLENLIITFHQSPKENLQQILEILFDIDTGRPQPLVKFLTNKKILTDTDLDILYSIYLRGFNTNNPNSFINQERQSVYNNKLCSSLIQELAAYIDSNVLIDYLETETDFEGNVTTKIKKKYFTNAKVYKLRTGINININNKSLSSREQLQKKYQFKQEAYTEEGALNATHTVHIITIGEGEEKLQFELVTNNNNTTALLVTAENNCKFSPNSKSIFESLSKVDLVELEYKITNNAKLTSDEYNLKNVLQFIKDYTGIDTLSKLGLQTLRIYAGSYTTTAGFTNYLMPLVQLAIRNAYINNQYIKAGDQVLSEFLEDDAIYKDYQKNKKSKLFTEAFGNVKYTAVTFADKVLDAWIDAQSILCGDSLKATTKDKSNNSLPNSGVNKMGGILRYYLHKQQNTENTKCQSLLFVNQPHLIKRTVTDLEASNIFKDHKNVKAFSGSELAYHAIFYKFWNNYATTASKTTSRVIIQPTVYSDKTTFLNWEIETDLLHSPNYVREVIDQYKVTLGHYYDQVYKDSIQKLNKIHEEYNNRHKSNINFNQFLKQCSEQELTDIAFDLNIELEKDKDYRVHKGKRKLQDGTEEKYNWLSINEILQYNAKLYKNENLLHAYLNEEKINFLQNLIDLNTSFQVIEYSDKYEYYTKNKSIDERASSKNSIISIIKNIYKGEDRQKFFEQWVDAKTGKLILAKQGDRNIFGIGNDFKQNDEVELNPLLDKFFYVEGFLSNNLRLSLTGSEINHPDKAFNTLFYQAKKVTSIQDLQKLVKSANLIATEEQYYKAIEELQQAYNITNLVGSSNPILQYIYEKTLRQITNTAQGTQFKRNVIIPATLQYCQQNLQHGITSKIKVATIYDEQADVFNYRGQQKEIDSSDGAARINPFQSILENQSLGSQAVGSIKKPIWHSYDTTSGTAFLAKFATFTMTHEEMRSSNHSSTALFKLFKQMTNLQWTEPIDLTKPLYLDSSIKTLNGEEIPVNQHDIYAAWFNNVILENQKLFYKNRYGETMEIMGFNKSTITLTNPSTNNVYQTSVYYTEERSSPLAKPHKVYHLFKKDTSEHITFISLPEVKVFLSKPENDYHTINSLFELHTALGGINCVDSEGNVSEFSNKIVVNFMNNIGSRKPGVKRNAPINQTNYYQPLKDQHIGYVLNNTAVKNGAKNINSSKAWKGESKLKYFTVDSDGLGMQMNADHDIVNSELTEFSQVIAATAAYGYTYDNCNEIFKGLARTAVQASKQAIDVVNKFLKSIASETSEEIRSEAKSELYDVIGRLVLVEGSIKSKENLTDMIKTQVLRIFNKYQNHKNDSVKIPFSDPNIYSDFCSILASVINKSSIKRKHPGSGCVMAPGYNVITYFEIGDKKYSQQDMLNIARVKLEEELKQYITTLDGYNEDEETYDDEELDMLGLEQLFKIPAIIEYLQLENGISLASIQDVNQFNIQLVKRYLNKLQKDAPFKPKDWFQPEDVVDIYNPDGSFKETIVLDSMQKFQNFQKENYPLGTTYQVNLTIPRNLKPSLIRWQQDYKVDLNSIGIDEIDITEGEEIISRQFQFQNDVAQQFSLSKQNDQYVIDFHPDTNVSLEKTQQDKVLNLFKAVASSIPLGETLTFTNNLSPESINLLKEFEQLGFEYAGEDSNGLPIYKKVGKFMNIFQHPVIVKAFENNGELDANHRNKVQKILDNLENGKVVINDVSFDIIKDSLENTEAELVMSNLYKDLFGIENESLAEILDQGEKFFQKQVSKSLTPPLNTYYDVALSKDSGKHTLISFTPVVPSDYCTESTFEHVSVNSDGEIYCMKNNRKLFKIGKYVELTKEEADDLSIEDGKIISKSGQPVDNYRIQIKEGITTIEKRVDYIKRFSLVQSSTTKSKKKYYTTQTLYEIIDVKTLANILGNEKDAHKQIGYILNNIYLQDEYKFIELNPLKTKQHKNKLAHLNSYLGVILGNQNINSLQQKFLTEQLAHLDTNNNTKKALSDLIKLKRDYYNKEAHKKWVSFQDSLKFISSRIPAQTLQSFMAMKCVGWTQNTNNVAYVSHFQTYLQGSDYDIDKAYIMGQSYNDNGVYVQWSPLFDFTDVRTLELSKQLPISDSIKLEISESGVDVTNELQNLLNGLTEDQNQLIPNTYQDRLNNLKTYIKLFRLINEANGKITYNIPQSPKLIKLINLIQKHIHYKIPENTSEAAYKNVASANIYAVSHNIRNRDQAYTEVTMKTLQDAAKTTPKNAQTENLNMLNPMTKYIMQYQNLVGKNVISIAANGEKIWFNAYYYWTKCLKENNTPYLQFNTTLYRVNRRSLYEHSKLDGLEKNAVTKRHLPDLNKKDEVLKENLKRAFNINLDTEQYCYVDQLISQLLSAATDNAKELILAKINSGSEFARMYVYLIMMGYNFDDIVAFMVSPISEFISSMASANMFSNIDIFNNATTATSLAQGIIYTSHFLHGYIYEYSEDPNEEPRRYDKSNYVKKWLLNKSEEILNEVRDTIRQIKPNDSEINLKELSLQDLMQGFILTALHNSNIHIDQLITSNDVEINTYLSYCQNILYKLKQVAVQYGDPKNPNIKDKMQQAMQEMFADAQEFTKIYQLSTEISGISSAWLGLNQGLPTSELELLERFYKMRKVITKREANLGINPKYMYTDSSDDKALTKAQQVFQKVVQNIKQNNQELDEQFIVDELNWAHEKNLMGTFDVYRYLTDEEYKKDMIRYNHLIKGTLNVLHMMETIPHYKEIMECLKVIAVSKKSLSIKNRLINQLISKEQANKSNANISEKQLKGIIKYVDHLVSLNFVKNLKGTLTLHSSTEGFDQYFYDIKTPIIDLSTFEGIATFKKYIETTFFDYLKENYSKNPLVNHLTLVTDNQRPILATDIDLLNPTANNITMQSYDDILTGMADFEQIKIKDLKHSDETPLFNSSTLNERELTVTDLLQLYNIVVNNNQYGDQRLTTAFQTCVDPNNMLNQYFKYISDVDYEENKSFDFELEDYYIYAANIISTWEERRSTAKYIKVNDPVLGYVLKRYNESMNAYEEWVLLPPKKVIEDQKDKYKRLQNFAEYGCFEMPIMAKISSLTRVLEFDQNDKNIDMEEVEQQIENLLLEFSRAGKIILNKLC